MMCCKYAKVINQKSLAQKKVSKAQELICKNEDGKEYEVTCVEKILKFIDYINSLPEFTEFIWDNKSLSDVPILNEFSDFVMPEAVRFNALDRRNKDVLVRPDSVDNPFDNYTEYINTCDLFRARFKKDGNSDVTMVSNLRRSVNLNDVIARASVGGRVNYGDKPFIPVQLSGISSLFEDRYFNDTVEGIMSDYISLMRF